MIKRLTTESEVAKLISIEDNYIEEVLGYTKGEWIQWLVSQVTNPKLFILANYNDRHLLDSYIVAFDSISPPIQNFITILYAYDGCVTNLTRNKEAFTKIKEWAVELNANRILIQTKNPEVLYKYGFKKIPVTVMELLL